MKQIKRNIIRGHRILLARKQPHPYKHACAQRMITYENRGTRPQKVKMYIIKRNNNELTGTVSRRVRGKRGRKCTRALNSLAKRDSRNTYPRNDYIGEHLLAENIGEHLFAKTENWNSNDVGI